MARTKISIASSNLYNLNLAGKSIYNDRDGWDAAIYDKKINWTASQIVKVNADVWGFQELWHQDALTQVFDQAGLSGEYTLLAPPNHNGHSIVCAGAVRSHLLVDEPEWIGKFPEKFILQSQGDDAQTEEISVAIDHFSRPLLHFKIKPRTDGKVISVYVAHLKSKAPTRVYLESWYRGDDYYKKHNEALGSSLSTIRRTAEATALRMILVDEMKDNDNPVLVLGDLNDSQHSNTLAIISGQPRFLTGLTDGGSDTDLYAVGTLQELNSLRDVYYTHVYQNTHESLDHILVSQEFYDHSRKRIWAFKGMEVFNDHLNEEDHKESGTSDHGIVKASFEYRPYR